MIPSNNHIILITLKKHNILSTHLSKFSPQIYLFYRFIKVLLSSNMITLVNIYAVRSVIQNLAVVSHSSRCSTLSLLYCIICFALGPIFTLAYHHRHPQQDFLSVFFHSLVSIAWSPTSDLICWQNQPNETSYNLFLKLYSQVNVYISEKLYTLAVIQIYNSKEVQKIYKTMKLINKVTRKCF